MIESEEHDLTSLTWLMDLRNQNFHLPNVTRSSAFHYEVHNSIDKKEVADGGSQYDMYVNCNDENGAEFKNSECKETSDKDLIIIQNDEEQTIITETTTENRFLKRLLQSKKIEKSNKIMRTALLSQQRKHLLRGATPNERYEIFLLKVKRDLEEYQKSAKAYQKDSALKPPFNYSHIIGMAILENGRVTLQEICTWIEIKFAYFRGGKKWNNSIRHNLSLHPFFRKIGRNKFEKGKGGYWELGVDLAKCNRKRIRNRKGGHYGCTFQQRHQQKQPFSINNMFSVSKNRSNLTKEIQQGTEIGSKLKSQQVEKDSVISYNSQNSRINSYYTNFFKEKTDEIHSNLITKSYSVIQSDCLDCTAVEHLLLDDLDIQQNIDIITCGQNPFQEYDIPISDTFRDIKFEKAMTKENKVNIENIQQTNDHQQQQYQLGTVIISTTETKLLQRNSNISELSASTGNINCSLNGDYSSEKQDTYPRLVLTALRFGKRPKKVLLPHLHHLWEVLLGPAKSY